ncbi:MAG: insulinase family protein, partial [Parabacteroides sp.]|nr:insulinase family protein [Parabacteroides sp.]
MGMGFRGVPANHEDQVAFAVAVNMLNNANGTGFLDKLMVDRKIMASMAMNESMNEAGILAVAVIPKLMFQTYGGAEKLVWKEINRVKEGDFSDEIFNSLKQEQRRQYASNLENIDSRARIMMSLYSQGKSWEDYLQEVSGIDALTKEDVVRVARKYFSENYLCVTKTTGKYPKDNLTKPDFSPIVPKNSEASSEYAKQLEQLPVQEVKPRFIDFQKDVETVSLTPLATLYATANPVTDIFTLNLVYQVGTLEQPKLMHLANYLQFLGTDSLSFHEFRTRLQVLGSTISFDATDKQFFMRITGFDKHFKETVQLAGDFIRHVKADDKQIRQVINDAKVTEKAFFESSDNIANALLEKVKYGEQSRFLTKLSLSEVKKLKGKELLDAFVQVRQTECDLLYCGTLPVAQVREEIEAFLPLKEITVAVNAPYHRDGKKYDKPTVYFMDMPTASQSIVYGYVKGEVTDDAWSRHAARLFSVYFGGDMSSLMFQEIREFRSLAYRVSGRYILPPHKLEGKAGEFVSMLSTQSDKTLDALGIMNSLIHEMPEKEERISTVKQSIVNQVNNDFPSFREVPEKVAGFRRNGFDNDPSEALLSGISDMDMKDIIRFYRHNVRLKPVVYVIVGNSRRIDMKQLETYGNVIRLRKKDIYK